MDFEMTKPVILAEKALVARLDGSQMAEQWQYDGSILMVR